MPLDRFAEAFGLTALEVALVNPELFPTAPDQGAPTMLRAGAAPHLPTAAERAALERTLRDAGPLLAPERFEELRRRYLDNLHPPRRGHAELPDGAPSLAAARLVAPELELEAALPPPPAGSAAFARDAELTSSAPVQTLLPRDGRDAWLRLESGLSEAEAAVLWARPVPPPRGWGAAAGRRAASRLSAEALDRIIAKIERVVRLSEILLEKVEAWNRG